MAWVVAKQVVDVNDHAPTVEVVFLGADDDEAASSGRVSRHARPGDTVARVSVADADRLDNVTVRLHHRPAKEPRWLRDRTSTEPPFHSQNRSVTEPFLLTWHGDGVYVVTLSTSLTELWYRLQVTATDSGSLTTSAYLDIFVDDDDTAALRFSRSIYRATLSTDMLPGSCVTAVRVTADHDEAMTYHRLDDGEMSNVVDVGRRNGRICTRSWLPCDSPTVVRLAILASDSSVLPSRSAAVAVELKVDRAVNVVDQVSFETRFYSVDVDEDVPVGHCVLTVSKCSYTVKCNSVLCLRCIYPSLQMTSTPILFCHISVQMNVTISVHSASIFL